MASDPQEVIFQAIDPDCDVQDVKMNTQNEVAISDATLRDLAYTQLLELRAMHITLARGLGVNRTEIKDVDQ